VAVSFGVGVGTVMRIKRRQAATLFLLHQRSPWVWRRLHLRRGPRRLLQYVWTPDFWRSAGWSCTRAVILHR